MSFSNTFETTVLTWVFTTSSATRPTAWHIALYTAAPNDTGGGTEVFDAASGGNLIAYAALTTSKTIDTGDVFRLPSGDLDITLD